MRTQRGSTTIMAIMAMLILTVAAASFAYMTRRNVIIAQSYDNGLKAQYFAEAAVRLMYVAGRESVNTANGWTNEPSLLDNLAGKGTRTIKFADGNADVTVSKGADPSTYKVWAQAQYNGASRVAINDKMSTSITGTPQTLGYYTKGTAGSMLKNAIENNNAYCTDSTLSWKLPADINDTSSPAFSPGYGTLEGDAHSWSNTRSQVLFGDSLGLPGFAISSSLQLLFRVNYYIKLTNVPSSGGGSGYGVYYLAWHTGSDKTGSATPGDPTAYVAQFDPGLNPTYNVSNTDMSKFTADGVWGAAFTNNVNDMNAWPYGAFLVKKVWSQNNATITQQTEVWDENGGNDYYDHYAFQDNNEWTQSPSISPSVTKSSKSTAMPSVTTVPTAFGSSLGSTMTGKYRVRPPDLRIPFTLGQLAEGDAWKLGTTYPKDAKVAVGVWVSDPLNNRVVWVAQTLKPGISTKNPTTLYYKTHTSSDYPAAGDSVTEYASNGTTPIITWTAVAAPTSAQIAQNVMNSGISLAKISMADLKYRLDSVNGTSGGPDQSLTDSYSLPFSMVQGNKNKITIELWVDNNNNRVQLIRVNDVLVLAFNDSYASGKKNIMGQNWESSPSTTPLGSGLRIWNAAAEFYTVENYGQLSWTSYTSSSNYGTWSR